MVWQSPSNTIGFPLGWHLNRAGRDRFRNKIDIFISFQLRTFEAHPHPIRIGRDNECVAR